MGRWGQEVWSQGWGESAALAEGGPDSTVEVYVSEESEEGVVTVLRQRGTAPRVRAAKSSEFR